MALVVTQEGAITLMGFLQRGIQLNPFLGLFINNVSPDISFTLASLVEATFTNYARQPMGAPTGNVALPGGGARLTWPDFTFLAGPAPPTEICYGYFVTQLDWTATPRLLWAERMTPKIRVPLPSSIILVQNVFDFSSLFT